VQQLPNPKAVVFTLSMVPQLSSAPLSYWCH
jgi:threonine/homoserine/homoserine lactone efflux protein